MTAMKVLFVMRNHGYMRNYASTVRMLASRGHHVVIGSRGPERHMAVDTPRFLDELHQEFPRVTTEILPRRADEWTSFAAVVRAARNALRYRHPSFRRASKLADRAERHLFVKAPRVERLLPSAWPAAALLSSALDVLERAIPTDLEIDASVERLRPDVMVVTPLVDFNSYQTDYVKTARRQGIPVALAVASWDNLTNKGVIAVQPDRVFIWNREQEREAIELHGVKNEHITITGAPVFDDWFALGPTRSREQFCHDVGLKAGKPFLLYLCSSSFVAPDEVSFVRDWVTRLHNSASSALREAGVLVRPHPGSAAPWKDADLSSFGNVVVWPREGAMPLETDAKQAYFDSIYHSAAVVGINTSGMIEAGIVGRRSFTVLAPEFAATQNGTVHFSYLTSPGFLMTAATFDEHFQQLAAELERPSSRETFAPFVRDFVRPEGLETPATERLVQAIEALKDARPLATTAGTWPIKLLRRVIRTRLDAPKRVPSTSARGQKAAS